MTRDQIYFHRGAGKALFVLLELVLADELLPVADSGGTERRRGGRIETLLMLRLQ